MGTSYCALFLFMTQDIVPEAIKDTPMQPSCQLTSLREIFSLKNLFTLYIHRFEIFFQHKELVTQCTGSAEVRHTAGIRFVANLYAAALRLLK